MGKLKLIIIFFLFSNIASGQNAGGNDEESVKQLLREAFEEVWSNLDTARVSKYHTDDFLLLENGVVWNNDSIKSYQVKEIKRNNSKRENKLDFVKIDKLGSSIWVAYHNFATWTDAGKVVGKAHWLESAIALKSGEGWKLKMLHSTRINDN